MAKQSRQKQQLGKGLKALLGNMEAELAENQEEVVRELSHTVAMIPLREIEVNPFQPRVDFEAEALEELATSIKTYGLIQPITVRRLADKKYQLISGERRMQASNKIGLREVPAYIRLANDQEMLEMALVENIQRENLNPIEVAVTYQRLIEECNLTHDEMSGRVGKKRSTVTNYLNLLELPVLVKKGLKEQLISTGHAKAIKGIKNATLQENLYQRTVRENLSVRELEYLVKTLKEIKENPLKEVFYQKIGDERLSTRDMLMLIQSLQKTTDSLLRYDFFERIFNIEDPFSIQDLESITLFLASIDDKELKEKLHQMVMEERANIMQLAAFVEKYNAKKARTEQKKATPTKEPLVRLHPAYESQERFLKEYLEVPVKLKVKDNGEGSITIPFKDVESFNDILEKIKGS